MSEDEKRPPLPAKRQRPHGGWVTTPIRSARHGADGPIGRHHRALRAAEVQRKAEDRSYRAERKALKAQ